MEQTDDRVVGHFASGESIFVDGDRGLGNIWAHPGNAYGLTEALGNVSFVEDGAALMSQIGDLRARHFPRWTVVMHREAADAFARWLGEGAEKDYPADEIEGFEAARTFHLLAADQLIGGQL